MPRVTAIAAGSCQLHRALTESTRERQYGSSVVPKRSYSRDRRALGARRPGRDRRRRLAARHPFRRVRPPPRRPAPGRRRGQRRGQEADHLQGRLRHLLPGRARAPREPARVVDRALRGRCRHRAGRGHRAARRQPERSRPRRPPHLPGLAHRCRRGRAAGARAQGHRHTDRRDLRRSRSVGARLARRVAARHDHHGHRRRPGAAAERAPNATAGPQAGIARPPHGARRQEDARVAHHADERSAGQHARHRGRARRA